MKKRDFLTRSHKYVFKVVPLGGTIDMVFVPEISQYREIPFISFLPDRLGLT